MQLRRLEKPKVPGPTIHVMLQYVVLTEHLGVLERIARGKDWAFFYGIFTRVIIIGFQ